MHIIEIVCKSVNAISLPVSLLLKAGKDMRALIGEAVGIRRVRAKVASRMT
jgi:hypothetical protein